MHSSLLLPQKRQRANTSANTTSQTEEVVQIPPKEIAAAPQEQTFTIGEGSAWEGEDEL